MVKNLIFGSGCYANVPQITINDFPILETLIFKSNSFRNTHTVYIESFTVTSITFESNTFNGDSSDGSLTLYTTQLASLILKSDVLKKISTIYIRNIPQACVWTLSKPCLISVNTIRYSNVSSFYLIRLVSTIKTFGGHTGSISFSPYSPAPSSRSRLLSSIELPVTEAMTSCADGQSLVEIVRTCGSNGSEESFEIHYGRDMSGMSVVFGQNTCVDETQYVCMSPVEYTLVMRDTGFNGWSTGSHLILNNGKVSLDFVMEGESVLTRKVFNFGTLLDQSLSAAAATGDQIEITLIRSCGNSSESEGFAIYAGSTRDRAIYSQTYCVAGVAKLLLSRGVYSVVMTEAEGRAWEANSVVRIFDGGLLGSFAKTAAGAEASAQFDCSEEVSTSVEQSLVGDGLATSNKAGICSYPVQNLFDRQVSTKFRVAVESTDFPVEVIYWFREGETKTMNKYVVTNGDSVSASCNSWKIFGKTNGNEEWVMIDSQDGVEWTGINESLSFSVNNVNAYNAYKFQCSSVVNIDDDWEGNQLEMAEWNLIEA